MTNLEKLNQQIREVKQKINEQAAAIESAEVAYRDALSFDDEVKALTHLEARDAAQRLHTMHSDRLPLLEDQREDAERKDAQPAIEKRCIALQEQCDIEQQLITEYMEVAELFHRATLRLNEHSHTVNTEINQLSNDIRQTGAYHPAVTRQSFIKPRFVLEAAQQNFAHFNAPKINGRKEYAS